ncbi:MAG: Uma2 family endonuclease [Candidatus Sumerlaeota bacterium]|nr:Uma2 family endonuclease [Candidatus Sumerlaeota bacterium]
MALTESIPRTQTAATKTRRLMTADSFWQISSQENFYGELVDGEVIDMTPPGQEHGYVACNICELVGAFVKKNKLGKLFNEYGYVLFRDPDTVRAPDISFIRAEKLTAGLTPRFSEIPPDLAIEVVSPSDSHHGILVKIKAYLKAGVEEVWIVNPSLRSIEIFRTIHESSILEENDFLETPLMPGLRLAVKDIFE